MCARLTLITTSAGQVFFSGDSLTHALVDTFQPFDMPLEIKQLCIADLADGSKRMILLSDNGRLFRVTVPSAGDALAIGARSGFGWLHNTFYTPEQTAASSTEARQYQLYAEELPPFTNTTISIAASSTLACFLDQSGSIHALDHQEPPTNSIVVKQTQSHHYPPIELVSARDAVFAVVKSKTVSAHSLCHVRYDEERKAYYLTAQVNLDSPLQSFSSASHGVALLIIKHGRAVIKVKGNNHVNSLGLSERSFTQNDFITVKLTDSALDYNVKQVALGYDCMLMLTNQDDLYCAGATNPFNKLASRVGAIKRQMVEIDSFVQPNLVLVGSHQHSPPSQQQPRRQLDVGRVIRFCIVILSASSAIAANVFGLSSKANIFIGASVTSAVAIFSDKYFRARISAYCQSTARSPSQRPATSSLPPPSYKATEQAAERQPLRRRPTAGEEGYDSDDSLPSPTLHTPR